jgi:hypothetical protein
MVWQPPQPYRVITALPRSTSPPVCAAAVSLLRREQEHTTDSRSIAEITSLEMRAGLLIT